tara:strand:- start:483 stop:1004 length:522 start_codon:yes stop_codon:yes gene_type:complete
VLSRTPYIDNGSTAFNCYFIAHLWCAVSDIIQYINIHNTVTKTNLSCQEPLKNQNQRRANQKQNQNQNQSNAKAAVGLDIIEFLEQNNTQKVAVPKINMLKWFKKSKPIPLGRWAIQQQHIPRKIDLANCDSCGVCPTIKPSLKLKYKYIIVDDDIVLEGIYGITDKRIDTHA